ncbi:MAG: glycosyltransferase family 4 protein, partial [Desulfurococcaceae archaeon]
AFKRIHKAKVVVKIPSLLEEEIKGVGNIKVHRLDKKIFERLLSISDRFVVYKADRIAVPSLLFYRELCKRRRVKSRAPPLITPPGVDLIKINKIRKMSEVESARDEREFTIGYIGLLEWWQGVDILVKAVHILQSDVNLRLKILIVGDGPRRNKIEVLCRNLNVRCEITGFVPHEYALKMMKRFEVLAVPRLRTLTTETNIPLKVIEAWALGIPVVITGHKILHSFEGFTKMPALFCEPRPESVAETLKLIIYNDKVVRELRDKGSMIVKRFNYDTIAKSIIEVVDGI